MRPSPPHSPPGPLLSQSTHIYVPKLLCHFVPLNKTLIRNGEVEESHRSQPVLQGSQKRNQKAKEASPHFNQRDGS
ncbi:hypothetical protein P8452_77474 [Trifolium repens]|nr:hypothetical protein P8452_77474 [Trifolium repens]